MPSLRERLGDQLSSPGRDHRQLYLELGSPESPHTPRPLRSPSAGQAQAKPGSPGLSQQKPPVQDGTACEEGSSLGLGLERPEVSEAEVTRDACCPRGCWQERHDGWETTAGVSGISCLKARSRACSPGACVRQHQGEGPAWGESAQPLNSGCRPTWNFRMGPCLKTAFAVVIS